MMPSGNSNFRVHLVDTQTPQDVFKEEEARLLRRITSASLIGQETNSLNQWQKDKRQKRTQNKTLTGAAADS